MAYIGTSPQAGVRRRYLYTATAGQTSFSGNDSNGVSLVYVDSEYLDVYQNGVKLKTVSDYASTTGTTVVLVSAASLNDIVEIIAHDIVGIADSVSAKDGGNFAGNVGMGGTLSVTGNADLNGDLDVDGTTNLDVVDIDGAVDMASTLNVTGTTTLAASTSTVTPFIMRSATQTFNGGLSTEVDTNIINFGLNEGSANRFGGSYTQASQGGMLNFDVRSGSPLFQIYVREAGTASASGIPALTILSAGNVLVNTTSTLGAGQGVLHLKGAANNTVCVVQVASNGEKGLDFRNSSNTQVGSISINVSSTAYNTSSDYRLKENVVTEWDATTRLKQLKPSRFNFIVDADTTVDGFLAHEVSSVVPEAISGTKDAVEVWKDGEELPDGVSVGDNKLDDDGNTIPVMQGIDQSKLVPLLVKTIQELEARITALENA